jgi:hypothetical protein
LGLKKGGKVKKFYAGGANMPDDAAVEREAAAYKLSNEAYKNDPESPGDTGSLGRFDDDMYRRAINYANKLRTPSGAEETEGKARTGLQEPKTAKPVIRKAAPKAAAPTPKASPKAAPKAAPKAVPKKDYGVGKGDNLRRLGDFELSSLRPRSEEKEVNQRIREATVRRSRAEDIYPSLGGKKAGGVVKKYAKGGGIEVKGKTRGRMV